MRSLIAIITICSGMIFFRKSHPCNSLTFILNKVSNKKICVNEIKLKLNNKNRQTRLDTWTGQPDHNIRFHTW